MKGKLNEFKTPTEGSARYNEGITSVDCSNGIVISCDEQNCNAIVFTDSDGVSKTLFSSLILVNAIGGASDCEPEDYRKNTVSKPRVNIRGFLANVNSRQFTEISFDLYPELGQTVEALRLEILNAICACSNPETPIEPIVPSVFGAELFTWSREGAVEIDPNLSLLNQDIILPAGKYIFHWTSFNNPSPTAGAETAFDVTGETNSGSQTGHSGLTYNNTNTGFIIIDVVNPTETVNLSLTVSVSPAIGSIENLSASIIGYRIQ